MREAKQARQGAKQLAGCALRPLLALLGDASSEVRAAAAADLGQTLAYVAAAAATAAAAPGSGPGPGPGSGAALGGGGGEWLAALVALEAGAQRDWRLHLSIIQALPSVLRARRRLFLLPAGCMPGVAQAPPSVLCARRCLHCCLLPACGRLQSSTSNIQKPLEQCAQMGSPQHGRAASFDGGTHGGRLPTLTHGRC